MRIIIPCASYVPRYIYGLLDTLAIPGGNTALAWVRLTGLLELLLTDKPVSDQKPSVAPNLPHSRLRPPAGLVCAVISFRIDGRFGSIRLAALRANIEQIGSVRSCLPRTAVMY